MNRCRSAIMAIVVLLAMLPAASGDPDRRRGGGTPSDIGFRSPSRDWIDRSPVASRGNWRGHGHHFPSYRSFSYGYSGFYGPLYGGSYWNSGCGYCGNYWCNGWCCGGTYWIPPVAVVDAGQLYGPRALRNFLGINNAVAAPVVQPVAPQAAPAVAPALALPARGNATARERAITFVQYGDRHFKEGRYREALARYKKATASAGDMAEAEFRKAFAELMMGDLSDATIAIRRGLAKKASWPDADFAVDDLFSAAAKADAYRLLQSRLQATDFDADAHFLLGVMLHFDGQIEAAQVHFMRTIELLGQAEHARIFLPQQPEAKDAAEVGE
ncbi:MAG: tetratricopeptide repeat protein [Pirellulales bacterium]